MTFEEIELIRKTATIKPIENKDNQEEDEKQKEEIQKQNEEYSNKNNEEFPVIQKFQRSKSMYGSLTNYIQNNENEIRLLLPLESDQAYGKI